MSDILEPQKPTPEPRREELVDNPYEREFLESREASHIAGELPSGPVEGTDYILRSASNNGVELEHRGLIIGAFTMVLIGFATFWAPGVSGLLAGAFGGFFAKRWKRAFLAAGMASVATPAMLAFLEGWTKTGSYHFLSGMGFWQWTALHIVCLFIGAASGVYSRPLAERRGLQREVPIE